MGLVCSCVSSEDIDKDLKKDDKDNILASPADLSSLKPLKISDNKDNNE